MRRLPRKGDQFIDDQTGKRVTVNYALVSYKSDSSHVDETLTIDDFFTIYSPAPRRYGWKSVQPDGRTRGDFQWPLTVGAEVSSCDAVQADNSLACPANPGDGLSVGLSARGMALCGFSSPTLLIVSWDDSDTAGEDDEKVRVTGPVRVEAVLDWWRLLREGAGVGANLSGANLVGADLYRVNLFGANLYRADLSGANLSNANLYRANLRWANLSGANLSEVNLGGADLNRADLSWANLSDANLVGANLSGADLSNADLRNADLSRAYLGRAYLAGVRWDEFTRWPGVFTPPPREDDR